MKISIITKDNKYIYENIENNKKNVSLALRMCLMY